MQKLLRRTAQAERQVERRRAKRNDAIKRASQLVDFRKRMGAVRDANLALNAARIRRREDWDLGPLAPQRDTPIRGTDGAFWGSVSLNRTMTELPDKVLELAYKWAGGNKYLCIKPGDRMAIMQGPDKGKIGVVKSIEEKEGTVALEGEHLQQNVTISDYITKAGLASEETFVQLTPLRVPIWALRLVHPLRDHATGHVRDVIINKLEPTRIIRDKPTGRETWSRIVPGLNIEIPWPRAFEEAERNELEVPKTDYESDTLRIDVDETTFVPTLLRPPLPFSVIDELRNRFSKFRTRYDPYYVQKKEDEEMEKRARTKAAVSMRTPLQELNALIREQKRQRPKPELTADMLVRIGELMARNQHRAPALKRVSQGLIITAGKRAMERDARDRLLAQATSLRRRAADLNVEAGKDGLEEAVAKELRAAAKKIMAKAEVAEAKAVADAKAVAAGPLRTEARATRQPQTMARAMRAALPPATKLLGLPAPAPQDTAPPPS